MTERVILHCDMNSFYASVELLTLPHLKGKPVAVSGSPEGRHGIILAKNDLAKSYGIVTAETVWQAKKKCPNLVLVKPHHGLYDEYSKKINEIYEEFTDMVEPYSIDESWLDVTGSQQLFGSGREIADQIREKVKVKLGLTLSVGVSFNKIFAKMGSEYKKPDATTEINLHNYKEILWGKSVGELFYVGKATEKKLHNIGIKTIGELALADKKAVVGLLGKHGGDIHNYANGIDDSPVCLACEKRRIKSVGNGITFKRDLCSQDDIRVATAALSDVVAGRLRAYQLKCMGIKVDIKDTFFKTISRQQQLQSATNLADEINRISVSIINSQWKANQPIRMLTITGIQLVDEIQNEQLSLFEETVAKREKNEKIERTVDNIRDKYGRSAITVGRILNNDIGIQIYEEDLVD